MAYNLSGIWTNSVGSHKDAVIIFQKGNTVVINGFGEKPKHFTNTGVGYIDEKENILHVWWTDLPGSKGTALGEVHKAKIEIKSKDRLKQSGDVLLPSGKDSTNDTYGNWERRK